MVEVTYTRLESFSNEILLDIFEYLDAYNLCQAFYGLNHRINTLLRSVHLHFLCDSTMEDIDIWNKLPSCFSPTQIRTLSMDRTTIFNKQLLASDNPDLRSIHLHGVQSEHIQTILEHLSDDNQIKSLHFIDGQTCSDVKRRCICVPELLLVDHGHRFRSLIELSLSPGRRLRAFPDVSVTFSQLRRLSLKNCCWNPSFQHFLHNNAPHLRSLQVIGPGNIVDLPTEFRLEHVRELDINYPGHMVYLRHILVRFPCLHRLHVHWEHNRRVSLIDGDFCRKLFEQHLPHLKQFTFDFQQGITESMVSTFFTNEFWLEKKLKITMLVNKIQSRHRLVKSISSGKQWRFQYFDHL